MPKVTMYSTTWCGDCRNAKRALRDAGIDFSEVDIDQDDDAAKQVIEWSGGRRVIPTILYTKCDSSEAVILHNPKGRDLDNFIVEILAARSKS